MFESPADAAAIYQQVLDGDPDNVTALAYGGWTLALSALEVADANERAGQFERATDMLLQSIDADPTYPDPYCFLAIVQYRFVGDASGAQPLVEACLLADPPGDVAALVSGMRDSIEADLAGG